MAERALLPVTLFLALGVVAWRQVGAGNVPPKPAVFTGVAVAYTILGVVGVAAPMLAGVLGAAVVIGLLLRPGLAMGIVPKPSTARTSTAAGAGVGSLVA